jgi:RHS repeat-associated protein
VQSRIDGTHTSNTYRVYDLYGNLLQESVPTAVTPVQSSNPRGYIPNGVAYSSLTYDSTYTYVNAETNPLSQTTSYTIDLVIGRPTDITNPDGSHLHLRYDEFGRLTKKWDDLDSETYPTTTYEYYWSNATAPQWTNVIHRADAGTSNTLWETHCYDGFGRQVQVRTPFDASHHSVVDTGYDQRGVKAWVSNPYQDSNSGCSAANGSIPRTTSSYDPLGNVSLVVNPDQTTVTADSNGLTTTTIDENGHKKVADAFGRTASVEEYTGTAPNFSLYATTHYTYDLLGNLTQVQDAAGNLTTMTYDMLGRKTAMSDPDAGDWQYVYDVAGNLMEEVDPTSAHSGRAYDALNRVTSRWYGSPGSPNAQFTYDSYPDGVCSGTTAVGRLAKMVDQSGTSYWCYDGRGRVTYERKSVDSVNYNIQSTYDSANRPHDVTYPDGEVVSYSYDSVHGQLRGMGSYLTNVVYNAALKPTSLPLGNSLTTTYTYDNRLRTTSIVTGSVQNLTYTYDNVGDVQTVTDSGTQTTFTYDELNRLAGASGGYTSSYEYNQIGNMTHKQEGSENLNLVYGNPLHVHAVTSVSGTTVATLTYDSRGNLASDGTRTYGYDMDNRLESISGAAQYTYDGQGALVKRTMADGSWTVYIGGIYEKHFDGTDVTYLKYYSALGRRIAVRDSATGVHYILSDNLGSSTVVTDSGGVVQGTMKYYPYGSERSATGDMVTDKLFTGQQKEPEAVSALGLYDYGARFYSTLTGRFVSPDPLVAAPGDPQTLNRYAYVRNNPLIFVDPTGLTECIVCGVGQSCEEGGIGDFKNWTIQYWIETGKVPDWEAGEALWAELTNEDFGELTQHQMIDKYDLFFVDTGLGRLAKEGMNGLINRVLNAVTSALPQGPIEVLLGSSEGGAVAYNLLAVLAASEVGRQFVADNIGRVILVQPAGQLMGGIFNLDAEDLPSTRIITVNAAHPTIHGEVTNAINVTGTESGDRHIGDLPLGANHGTMSRTAPFVMHLMFILPTTHSWAQDMAIVALLNHIQYGIENEWSLTGQ